MAISALTSRTQEKLIDGVNYSMYPLGAITGKSALLRLAKVLGPVFDGGDDIVSKLGDRLSEQDLAYFCDLFSERTTLTLPDGATPCLKNVFDQHFAGNYGSMFAWLWFAIQVNFSSFLAEIQGVTSARSAQKTLSPSVSPPIVTGK